ncbi:glycosyltransferase family 2 protein [Phascolarctobacterium sp.]|uniref:glycosyltransferase family 2 protein n=1 Tax=Phascolarctobacterium sp. TaxID=2049039 RepID=UPI003076B40D
MIDDLVSIIMPAYNAEKYIEEAIQSVLKQTYTNWELIIVNDNSSDDTEKIIKKYKEQDKDIKLYSLPENQGVANARNIAIRNADGRYIAFLDSDDMWLPEKLEKQIMFMRENCYAFTYHRYRRFTNIDRSGKVVNIPSKLNYKEALKGNSIGCLTVCIDKSKIKSFLMPQQRHEDYITWLNILKENKVNAYGLQDDLARYRIGSKESVSANKFKSAIWTWNVYRNNQKLSIFKALYCMLFYIKTGITKRS